jgi:hypothetical protein
MADSGIYGFSSSWMHEAGSSLHDRTRRDCIQSKFDAAGKQDESGAQLFFSQSFF